MAIADRAYLAGGRAGAGLTALEAETKRILAVLSKTGATHVEPPALQPAKALLDLYGEDIRARAFMTRDDRGEMMLRPDFTLPIVRLHMEQAVSPARYVYSGSVWRRQEFGSLRPREYLQTGLEIFGETDVPHTDAEVLCLIREALSDLPVRIVTGDMGLLIAGIDALETSEARRNALRRHLWRPKRFQQLLRRFGPLKDKMTAARTDLLDAARSGRLLELIAEAGVQVGSRTREEVAARVARLLAEAETPALDNGKVAALEAIMAIKGNCFTALGDLRGVSASLPGLIPAIDRFEARLDAFAHHGVAPETLGFEAEFGRTTLEYYDGFVFGAVADNRDDLPPIASGGRYDALTEIVGHGRKMPAVGAIIRPEALLAVKEGLPSC
ncbi:MAG: ATP phosphoribosyltransferase regulatory subunit [Pseudomonadota bacterium]